MTKNAKFSPKNHDSSNALTRSERAKILALDQYFVLDRTDGSDGPVLIFNDQAFLECLCNSRAFFEEFAAAAQQSAKFESAFNLRIRLRPDGMFEAYFDKCWHDLIGLDSVVLDETLFDEAGLSRPEALDVVAIELLQSAWCRLSLDAHLHMQHRQLAHEKRDDLQDTWADVEQEDEMDAEAPLMMRLN